MYLKGLITITIAFFTSVAFAAAPATDGVTKSTSIVEFSPDQIGIMIKTNLIDPAQIVKISDSQMEQVKTQGTQTADVGTIVFCTFVACVIVGGVRGYLDLPRN